MENDLLPILANRLKKWESMPTPDLVDNLSKKLSVTADALMDLACIVRTLEGRGEDLNALKIGIMPMLRKIAYGQLLPELVTQFAGKPTLLQYAQNLPIPDQKRLLSGEAMPVSTASSEGITRRMIEPHRMSTKEIRQVFAQDHIRDEGEQRSYLEDRRPRVAAADDSGVVINQKRGGASINGKFLSRAELASILARLG